MKKNTIVFTIIVCFLLISIYPAKVLAGDHRYKRFHCRDRVKVMTRNLYLGADIFSVLAATQDPDPSLGGLDVPIAVATLFETVQYTNFLERAEAIAKEIWMTRPHLIGLQEVSIWYTQSPSDFFSQNPKQADNLVYDYLTILLNALAAKGLHYDVAASVENADVELPMLTEFIQIPGVEDPVPLFDDLRLMDRDIILVRSDVAVLQTEADNYNQNLMVEIGGVVLEFTRGWTAAEVDICGETYLFANTHLEIAGEPGSPFRAIQAAQMYELLTEVLVDETRPIVLVGDFNSSPQHVPGEYCQSEDKCLPYVPPYMQATMDPDLGYLDAWELIFWPRDGFTSGFDEFVSDPSAELTERIDIVLLKPQEKEVQNVVAITTGDKPFSMTPGGLWPSDHAGVVARIKFSD